MSVSPAGVNRCYECSYNAAGNHVENHVLTDRNHVLSDRGRGAVQVIVEPPPPPGHLVPKGPFVVPVFV